MRSEQAFSKTFQCGVRNAEYGIGGGSCAVADEHLYFFRRRRQSRDREAQAAHERARTGGPPPTSELWEIPELMAAGGPLPKFTVRCTFEAAPAKGRELLEAVQRFASTRGASAPPSQVWLCVSGGANAVAMVMGYPSLAALEQARAAALADPSTQAFEAQIAALTAPVRSPEIFEILAPTS